jgi:2-keto-3-deoxy-L-rhamnonate aldolase RhmA
MGAIRRENTLKQRLYAGKAACGVMCTFPSPPVAEMSGYLGFDWIRLDNEHGSITVDTAKSCIATAEISGMAPIVRPVGNKPEIIAPFLDRGAWGVQRPHVNTADEARAAPSFWASGCSIPIATWAGCCSRVAPPTCRPCARPPPLKLSLSGGLDA